MGLSRELLKPFRRCPYLLRALSNTEGASKSRRTSGVPKMLDLYETKPPYTPIAAYGPWMTYAGSGGMGVVYDAGGYGMLSLGHNRDSVVSAVGASYVQANQMTRSMSHHNMCNSLRELSARHIVALNSGSEANTLAMRIANVHEHRSPYIIALKDSFHGRTEGPAAVSDSCAHKYEKHMSQPPGVHRNICFVEPNHIEGVNSVFDKIKKDGGYVELTVLEAVMGEGRPAMAIDPDFYKLLYFRTREQGGLTLIDSVQAGLRCHGVLSITDYPGFEYCPRPDMETFSKAIHSGQYPVSILALNDRSAARYRKDLYGNTMTATPRSCQVVAAVMDEMTTDLRENVVLMGKLLKQSLEKVCNPMSIVNEVRGVGLLVAISICKSVDVNLIERRLRKNGLNIITASDNSIRITPWFLISATEVDLICKVIELTLSDTSGLQVENNWHRYKATSL